MKKIIIYGGGTISHVRSHLALCAPAYGNTARTLAYLCPQLIPNMDVCLRLTKMAGPNHVLEQLIGETNEDVEANVQDTVSDLDVKIIFFSCAMCDFEGMVPNAKGEYVESGKYSERLKSRDFTEPGSSLRKLTSGVRLIPAPKVIKNIRQGPLGRKDIFLVGFKTTCGATADEQYIAGLDLLKDSSCNLVFCNDVSTRWNMVITPEEARYHETRDRSAALKGLVEMAALRSQLTFTRSTVVAGESIPWDSSLVPDSLRKVVNYLINHKAYKPFKGSTVGHFAAKIGPTTFLTSKRKTNFNDLSSIGLVKVETDGEDSVIAYGSKPSVGGQSQRIVFSQHPEYDCIAHFHSPIREGSEVPTISQREYECGSMQCGTNTSQGLKQFGNLKAVYLDQHGPNIVFHNSIDPQEVIDFIEANFDLSSKTGGPVTLESVKGS